MRVREGLEDAISRSPTHDLCQQSCVEDLDTAICETSVDQVNMLAPEIVQQLSELRGARYARRKVRLQEAGRLMQERQKLMQQ